MFLLVLGPRSTWFCFGFVTPELTERTPKIHSKLFSFGTIALEPVVIGEKSSLHLLTQLTPRDFAAAQPSAHIFPWYQGRYDFLIECEQ